MFKILITGGCGFIGTNFILKLMQETDNTLLNLDKLTYAGNIDNLSSISDKPNYQFIEGDICNEEVCQQVCQRVGVRDDGERFGRTRPVKLPAPLELHAVFTRGRARSAWGRWERTRAARIDSDFILAVAI